MFTTVAWSESIDAGGVLSHLTAVPDTHVRTDGDGIVIGEYNRLVGALACVGATATQARFVSPSIRRLNAQHIRPLELAICQAGIPNVSIYPDNYIQLEDSEDLKVEENGNPAAAEQCSIVAFLSSGAIQPVSGKIITINFSITVALVAGAWAFSEMTFADELPVGNYTVVGMELVAAAAVAARLVPKGGVNRPGCPTIVANNFGRDSYFRQGRMGNWLDFKTTTPPGVEVLSSAAAGSATYQGYLDVIAK
jgi:hypothetical protein